MKVTLEDHNTTLTFWLKERVILIRRCRTLDGRFNFKGIDLPLMGYKAIGTMNNMLIWELYTVPFLMFGIVTRRGNF